MGNVKELGYIVEYDDIWKVGYKGSKGLKVVVINEVEEDVGSIKVKGYKVEGESLKASQVRGEFKLDEDYLEEPKEELINEIKRRVKEKRIEDDEGRILKEGEASEGVYYITGVTDIDEIVKYIEGLESKEEEEEIKKRPNIDKNGKRFKKASELEEAKGNIEKYEKRAKEVGLDFKEYGLKETSWVGVKVYSYERKLGGKTRRYFITYYGVVEVIVTKEGINTRIICIEGQELDGGKICSKEDVAKCITSIIEVDDKERLYKKLQVVTDTRRSLKVG